MDAATSEVIGTSNSNTIWQGPRPYLETDSGLFFGRTKEIKQVLELIERHRLSLVTAPSGVGKTSLLMAGVVPRLRTLHHQELQGHRDFALGPTLVARTWAESRTGSDDIIVNAVRLAIDQLGDPLHSSFLPPEVSGPDDAGALPATVRSELSQEHKALKEVAQSTINENIDWPTFASLLADRVERLVVFFDQFEDALRLSADSERLLAAITTTFQEEQRIKIVLSLRQEYIMTLHDLEVALGGVLKRTYYLKSMRSSAVTEIVTKPAMQAGITVEEPAIATMLSWVKKSIAAEAHREKDQGESGETPSPPAEQAEREDLPPLTLLKLQALLIDIREAMKAKGRRVLDTVLLNEYEAPLKGKDLPDNALAKYFDTVLKKETNGPAWEQLGETARGVQDGELDNLLYRLAARIAPHLTSGARPGAPGYKNQLRLHKLVTQVLEPDLDEMGYDSFRTKRHEIVQLLRDPAGASVNFMWLPDVSDSDSEVVSGAAKRIGWLKNQTARVLVLALAELLARLAAGNVVKKLMSEGEPAYELVHDGLGGPLMTWGKDFQRSLKNALASITVINGIAFKWDDADVPEGYEIANITWHGCVVAGGEYKRLVFRNCDLRGVIFRKCIFRGGAFENCILDGAMFKDCKWFPANQNSQTPFRFERGSIRSALFKSCGFERTSFSGVSLDGTVFDSNDVSGKITIEDSSLNAVVMRGCVYKPATGAPARNSIWISDSDVFCCRLIMCNYNDTPVIVESSNHLHPESLIESFSVQPVTRHPRAR